ncbi:MAG TPA: response regulator [Rhodocyclaceae bacterium]|nr:response regulator [Rhodocyclaceae bacterium]
MSIFDKLGSLFARSEPAPAPTPGPELPAATPLAPVERRIRKRMNARPGTCALIIDDSRTILVALGRMLQSAGIQTIAALDAETGLEMARAGKANIIFLDIILPGMNGFSALRALRRDPLTRDLPVIMMSGNEQATEQFFGARIGADDFMKKPFSRLEVFARIERLLDENLHPRRPAAAPKPAAPAAPLSA